MPSPLREQIAHAIREAQARYGVRQAGYGYRPHRDAAEAAAHAVLPLVEAAVAAEREQDVRDAYVAGYGAAHIDRDEAVAAERLRLHTQLRDLPAEARYDVAITDPLPLEPPDDAEWWVRRDDVLALLGVAASPQPEGTTP